MFHLTSDLERKALIEFYHATNGPEWSYSGNWCSEEPLSAWSGVSVDRGHVVELSLDSTGLKGKPLSTLSRIIIITYTINDKLVLYVYLYVYVCLYILRIYT